MPLPQGTAPLPQAEVEEETLRRLVALAARPRPASAAELAQGFTRAPRAKVAELPDTLASLGHARRLEDGRYLPG